MTITRFDLEQLEKQSQFIVDLCKNIKSSFKTSDGKLFENRQDYEDALKSKNHIPEDFYYFRCFDVQSKITFNIRLQKYCIYLEGFYSDVLNNFKNLSRSSDVYIISEDFDKTLTVWQDVIYDILRHKVVQSGLF